MTALRRGDAGPDVARLQRCLAGRGFQVGRLDGRFGERTEAALLAFQRANGLLADGVYGPRTRARLDQAIDPAERATLTDTRLAFSLGTVTQLFPATPAGNIARHLPLVLRTLHDRGIADKPMTLTALATIRAESEGFLPLDERPSRFNTSPNGHPFDLYDRRSDLGNRGRPDGERFRGRGFVQLTGRDNYARHGKAIGLAARLVQEPDRANDPEIAARLLAAFLAPQERPIKESLLDGDLLRVRRIVNGGTHGYARFADAFLRGDRLIDDPVWPAGSIEAAMAKRQLKAG